MAIIIANSQMDGCRLSKKAVISLSGGMDSTSLLINLLNQGYEVFCVSFNYGQKHVLELDKAKSTIKFLFNNGYLIDHKIVDLTSAFSLMHSSLIDSSVRIPEGHYEESQMKTTVVPNRNAIFASILYGYAISLSNRFQDKIKIALGAHSGDHTIYPDCRPEFFNSINDSFAIGNWESDNISFYLPYINGDKKTILQDLISNCNNLKLDFKKILVNTITSYKPDERGRSSGKTGSDIERILAFNSLGLVDPISYVKPWKEVVNDALNIELRHQVTRNNGTERAFTGFYDDHFLDGEYDCYNCGHKLFSSNSKFKSGCGWPSFHTEDKSANIKRITDNRYGMKRIEVRCSQCDSHLGHVFEDGPINHGGERYCINSVSLDFRSN